MSQRTKTCYDCQQNVTDLYTHRQTCPKSRKGTRGNSGTNPNPRMNSNNNTNANSNPRMNTNPNNTSANPNPRMNSTNPNPRMAPRNTRSTIECYDCHEQVADLRAHRSVCKNSRVQKTRLMKPTPPPVVESELSIDDFPVLPTAARSKNTVDYYGIIDTSSSMSGSRIDIAKNVLADVISRLPESDRLAVITFDDKPYFRLKPRPVGQIRRQNEIPDLLSRIKTQGITAIWDAIWMAVEQLQDKSRSVILNVLTDGEDNSSTHTYQQVLDFVSGYPNIKLNITHVTDAPNVEYTNMCEGRGKYRPIKDVEMSVTFSLTFTEK